jgi:hypothetical protein
MSDTKCRVLLVVNGKPEAEVFQPGALDPPLPHGTVGGSGAD